jgi:hypothetical protein
MAWGVESRVARNLTDPLQKCGCCGSRKTRGGELCCGTHATTQAHSTTKRSTQQNDRTKVSINPPMAEALPLRRA